MDKYGDEFCKIFKYAVEVALDKGYLDDEISEFLNNHRLDEDPEAAWDRFYEIFYAAMNEYFGE